jgi:hypothetical protein
MYRVAWPTYAHSSISACADAVRRRTLPRHAFLEQPASPWRARCPWQQPADAREGAEAGADVVLLDLEDAVEDDTKRAREPIIAAMRELGWSACSGCRASPASSRTGATASSSR